MASNGRQVRRARGRDRRGGADAGRSRARGEGLLQGHPPLEPAREDLHRADRARRDRRPPRSRTSSPAACSSSASRRSTSAATPGSRPGLPIETPATTVDRQCGSAQQAVNFAAALIASGVHDVAIGGGVEHMGHISFADGMAVQSGARAGLLARADGALQPRPAGDLGRDDRRQVGDPALGARRDRRCARTSSPRRRPRRAASTARSSRSRSTATPTRPTRASAPRRRSRSCRS